MILRTLLVIFLFVVSTATYDDAEAEDTKPITAAKFNEKYKEYVAKIKECGQRLDENMVKECKEKEDSKFRTITHRGVNSEVIEELSCKKGKFGRYELIVDGSTQEVDLPC